MRCWCGGVHTTKIDNGRLISAAVDVPGRAIFFIEAEKKTGLIKMALIKMVKRSGRKIYGEICTAGDSSECTVGVGR
jgi:hypothetical protein